MFVLGFVKRSNFTHCMHLHFLMPALMIALYLHQIYHFSMQKIKFTTLTPQNVRYMYFGYVLPLRIENLKKINKYSLSPPYSNV